MSLAIDVQTEMPPQLPKTRETLMYACILHSLRDGRVAEKSDKEIEVDIRSMIAEEFPKIAIVEHFAFDPESDTSVWSMKVRIDGENILTLSNR